MKIKLDRSKTEITKDGVTYRVGNYYHLKQTEPTDSINIFRLNEIEWDSKYKAYFLHCGETAVNLNFAALQLSEVDVKFLECEVCGHLNVL